MDCERKGSDITGLVTIERNNCGICHSTKSQYRKSKCPINCEWPCVRRSAPRKRSVDNRNKQWFWLNEGGPRHCVFKRLNRNENLNSCTQLWTVILYVYNCCNIIHISTAHMLIRLNRLISQNVKYYFLIYLVLWACEHATKPKSEATLLVFGPNILYCKLWARTAMCGREYFKGWL